MAGDTAFVMMPSSSPSSFSPAAVAHTSVLTAPAFPVRPSQLSRPLPLAGQSASNAQGGRIATQAELFGASAMIGLAVACRKRTLRRRGCVLDWRPLPSARRTAAAASSEELAAAGGSTVMTDGGLAFWRTRVMEKKRPVPIIFFPVLDLLLPGQTKRMHLFEPRWVDMVEEARSDYGGIIGMIYYLGNGQLLPILTIVEIIDVFNMGEAGRMVTVRAVARGRVHEISKQAVERDQWGCALVEELQEATAEEFLPGSDAYDQCKDLAQELSQRCEDIDLSEPLKQEQEASAKEAPSQQGDAKSEKAQKEEEDSGDSDGPVLWGHERQSHKADFESWADRLEVIKRNLQGVIPMSRAAADELTEKVDLDMMACFYAALAGSHLRERLDFFLKGTKDYPSLHSRLTALNDKLKEAENLASVKRSLASAFSES
eukprot:TRINITY_DN32887_c0_g1_i1.p1 TRINITY_DN32887_c0_g1~~TRINITY_DN32887_c0_g1_i1.p1  ORF type:complete len:430 (-),score=124.44 TRINITY_DN32887_c0_g1_i1:174-1463(-)